MGRTWQSAARRVAAAGLVALAGCAHPPDDVLARRSGAQPPSPSQTDRSRYLGWVAFQAHCARCHGPDARGIGEAPDLLPRVALMSEQRFVGAVLRRYSWIVAADEGRHEEGARPAMAAGGMDGRDGTLKMPAWAGDPGVETHISDLYAFLSARANGTLGPGQPPAPSAR